MKHASLLFVFLFLLSSAANAAEPKMPLPIAEMVKGGAVARYLGNDQGLDGWVTFKGGQENYFYATPDGTGIVNGVLFNQRGDTVTLRQIEQLRAREGAVLDKLAGVETKETTKEEPKAEQPKTAQKPDTKPQTKADQFYAAIENGNWFTLGDKTAPVMYTFADTQCPHCKDMIKTLIKSGVLDNGQLQLRVLPVGILSEDSQFQAAYLLAAPTAAADFLKLVAGDKNAVPVNKNLPTLGALKNLSLMQTYKIDVTPFTVYKNKNGAVKILRGVPENVKDLMKELR